MCSPLSLFIRQQPAHSLFDRERCLDRSTPTSESIHENNDNNDDDNKYTTNEMRVQR